MPLATLDTRLRGVRASAARPNSGYQQCSPATTESANEALECRPEMPRFGGPPERSEGRGIEWLVPFAHMKEIYGESWEWRMWQVDEMVGDDFEQLDAEIAQVFGILVELLRAKGLWRESRKQRRRNFKVHRERTRRQNGVRWRWDVGEDSSVR
ncbi:hypothetical protein FB451DRAFT_1185916 [Mycena latifolia]|nr:hypothetical protein FB451DRAFT_1185916 [Mycena latifolia]